MLDAATLLAIGFCAGAASALSYVGVCGLRQQWRTAEKPLRPDERMLAGSSFHQLDTPTFELRPLLAGSLGQRMDDAGSPQAGFPSIPPLPPAWMTRDATRGDVELTWPLFREPALQIDGAREKPKPSVFERPPSTELLWVPYSG